MVGKERHDNVNYKIVAVDFDGTLFEDKWPEIGEPNTALIDYLKKRQEQGDKLILWTCRCRENLDAAVKQCEEHGLIFDAVNENLPEAIEMFGDNSRKIFAHEYIDDKNYWPRSTAFTLPYRKTTICPTCRETIFGTGRLKYCIKCETYY